MELVTVKAETELEMELVQAGMESKLRFGRRGRSRCTSDREGVWNGAETGIDGVLNNL